MATIKKRVQFRIQSSSIFRNWTEIEISADSKDSIEGQINKFCDEQLGVVNVRCPSTIDWHFSEAKAA